MRVILLAIAAVAALASCQVLSPLPASRAPMGMDGVATLASINTCEYDVAPLKTKVIVARNSAARALASGRMSVDQAKQVQATADAARALLDRACPKGPQSKEVDRDVVSRASKLLEGVR